MADSIDRFRINITISTAVWAPDVETAMRECIEDIGNRAVFVQDDDSKDFSPGHVVIHGKGGWSGIVHIWKDGEKPPKIMKEVHLGPVPQPIILQVTPIPRMKRTEGSLRSAADQQSEHDRFAMLEIEEEP